MTATCWLVVAYGACALTGSDGVTYDLPTGTYYSGATSTTTAVLVAVESAAAEVGHRTPMIVATEVSKNPIANLPATPAYRKGA